MVFVGESERVPSSSPSQRPRLGTRVATNDPASRRPPRAGLPGVRRRFIDGPGFWLPLPRAPRARSRARDSRARRAAGERCLGRRRPADRPRRADSLPGRRIGPSGEHGHVQRLESGGPGRAGSRRIAILWFRREPAPFADSPRIDREAAAVRHELIVAEAAASTSDRDEGLPPPRSRTFVGPCSLPGSSFLASTIRMLPNASVPGGMTARDVARRF